MITDKVAEADDAERERRRRLMHEGIDDPGPFVTRSATITGTA